MTKRYGTMEEVEADYLDGLLDRLKREFGEIRMLEIGVFNADTVRGVYRRGKEIDCPVQCSGVDWVFYDPNPSPDPNYDFHAGDSMDAWRTINQRYNLLVVDGCHCIAHSSQDFLNYSPFVVVNGYCLFHDTALPAGKEKQEAWNQNHSYAGTPDSVLGVREGLKKLGLLQGYRTDWRFIDEVPSDTGLSGMMLFQKTMEL